MTPERPLFFPPFRFDPAKPCLLRGEELIPLRKKSLAVLRYLVEHSGRVVTKKELLGDIWPDTYVSAGVPAVCIRELRRALGDEAERPRFIETVPRRGYRFIGKVTTAAESEHGSIPLVGREAELGQLQGWLEKALAGERQVVCVTGEPGIGKTTLVEAFLGKIVAEGDLWAARGQCIEHYGAGEAYLPVLEALERLCRTVGGKQLIGLLRQHAPMWLAQMPSLLDSAEREGLQRRLAGAKQERMLREIAQLLEALTAEKGLVLWLEDLHWSDYSTLDLLSYLARRHERARLLVIGTYRPVEVLTQEHPLRQIKQELELHGNCQELALSFLTDVKVAQYLAARFAPDGDMPLEELAKVIHQRTKGNPLFMVKVVEDLVARELIARQEERWVLKGKMEKVAEAVPASLRQFIEQQVTRVGPEERQILEAASVVGMEFSAAAVAAQIDVAMDEVERRCEVLLRREQFLRASGMVEWPDGTVSSRYSFVHVLYQNVLYERVPEARRVRLHRLIGEREETGYGAQAGEIAAELAMHFERGQDYRRAVYYLGRTGKNAVRRNAFREAISYLTTALNLLKTLPDTPERKQQELTLQIAIGVPLAATKGNVAPEVERVYTRARELCQQVGETPQLFPALFGLWRFYLLRAETQTGREIAEQLMRVAQKVKDPGLLLTADRALGETLLWSGEMAKSQSHLEQGIALYDPQKHRSDAFLYGGVDSGLHCISFSAHALWLLGYPEQSLKKVREALTLAQGLSHPYSLAFALTFGAQLYQYRREVQVAREWAEEGMALANEQGFPRLQMWASITRGWALAAQGQVADGIVQFRQGMTAYGAREPGVHQPYLLGLLAEAYGKVERAQEGHTLLAEALAAVEKGDMHVYEAELYRIKGELLLAQEGKSEKAKGKTAEVLDADGCFQKAVEIAHGQSAKSLELRAAMSLSQLRQGQGKKKEARQTLAKIYGWFTEGFDTADLKEAKALLEELS